MNHRFSFSFLFICIASMAGVPAQNFNRIHPPHLFDYEFQIFDSTDFGYYLFTPLKRAAPGNQPDFHPLPMILDEKGYVLWYGSDTISTSTTDFKYDPVWNRYLYLAYLPGSGTVGYQLGPSLEMLDTIDGVGAFYLDQHDITIRPDGVRIVHGTRDSIIDLSAFTILGNPGSDTTHCRCHIIQEIDSTDNLIWEWNSCNHLHPSLGYGFYGYNINDYDYAHFNSLFEEADGNYIVSYRHMNAIVKIDRQTDSVIWILGGKDNQFTFTNTPAFTAQHYARRLPSGAISLFDNANMSPNNESRALQLQLDTINMTATRVFAYKPLPGFNAVAMGSYQVTDSAQLINYGFVNRPNPSADLIDVNKNLLKRIYFQDSVMSYRGILYRPNTPFPRPSINCIVSSGIPYLEAPVGFAEYLWSDGQTTQMIVAQPNTEYQVWVTYGTGMLGSEPIHTASPLPCGLVGLVPPKIETRVLTGTFDLLGRPVSDRRPNQVYIERFSDGNSRQVTFFD